jgi:hypothetical protein
MSAAAARRKDDSDRGQKRRFAHCEPFPMCPTTDIIKRVSLVRLVPILLQKSVETDREP